MCTATERLRKDIGACGDQTQVDIAKAFFESALQNQKSFRAELRTLTGLNDTDLVTLLADWKKYAELLYDSKIK